MNAPYNPNPALFLTRFRGGIMWLGREDDSLYLKGKIGFVVTYRIAQVMVWNGKDQCSEALSCVCLN